MKQKLLILILFIILFLPIGLSERIENNIDNIENVDNTKIYNDKEKLISIYDKNNNKSMDIKLIYIFFDIDKMIKIVNITNYIEYIPDRKKDFITKSEIKHGKNGIYKTEYFIKKYNYDNITIKKEIYNNKTKENEIIFINKIIINNSYWVEYQPYNKKILKNETFILKIIHYKKVELGFFKIQTIPIFKNIECKEFTWWLGNWDLKRPILINNTMGDYVTDYQLKSINLSQYQINASSTRIINETSGLQLNFWNESINSNGDLEYVYINFTEIKNNTWINNTYYIYYQSIPMVFSISNGTKTFIQYYNETSNIYKKDNIIINNFIYEIKIKHSDITNNHIQFGLSNSVSWWLNDANQFDIYYYLTKGSNGYNVNNGVSSSIGMDGVLWIPNIYYKMKIINNGVLIKFYKNNILLGSLNNNIPDEKMGLNIRVLTGGFNQKYVYIRKYTENEPELWTVGNIEYPEVIDMNCSINIITHLTEKQIKTTYTNGSIINESLSNIQIILPYDSYIVYMSNPVKITSITNLFNIMDNILIQFFLFVLIIIISIVFVLFLNIIKNKGFKGVTK